MRISLVCLLCVSAATGVAACGSDGGHTCHTFQATCSATCLDGSTPTFTATTDCMLATEDQFQGDPRDYFCDDPSPLAANYCPSGQASGGNPYYCQSCSPFSAGVACQCPDYKL